MYDWLASIDWEGFYLDEYAMNEFFAEFGIDPETFDQEIWEEIKVYELGIHYMAVDFNYILYLLDYLGVDTDELNHEDMYLWLLNVDYDNFVLDKYSLEEFFTAFDIDSSKFKNAKYEDVLEWLEINEMPYEVHYILDILYRVEYPDTDSLNQTEMYDWLASIDYDNYILDTYSLEQFFEAFGIDEETFGQPDIWETIKSEELGIYYMPYDVNYILDILRYVGYPEEEIAVLSQEDMYEYLYEIDYDHFILDEYALNLFFEEFSI